MNDIAALLPPVVVCAAFIALLVAVKRHADREESQETPDNNHDSL
jgi:hypothetical protein